MSNSLEVTSANFQTEVIASATPALVDFYAEWCGPCKMMSPVLDEVAAELSGQIKICKVNCDSDGPLAGEYGVSSIPCLVLFKNGKEADRKIGACSKNDLVKWLKEGSR